MNKRARPSQSAKIDATLFYRDVFMVLTKIKTLDFSFNYLADLAEKILKR